MHLVGDHRVAAHRLTRPALGGVHGRPFARKALELGEKEFGLDHPATGGLLDILALLHRAQGRYAEAEPLHKRALAVWGNALGPDHPNIAASLNNLAGVNRDQSRYAEAEPLFKRALAIAEKTLGPGHPNVAVTLADYAACYGRPNTPMTLRGWRRVPRRSVRSPNE